MKKNFYYFVLTLTLILMSCLTSCDTNNNKVSSIVLQFDRAEYNLGTIKISAIKEPLLLEYNFTNISDTTVVILDAAVDCKCISAEIPQVPIQKGETASIKIAYNPKNEKPGAFKKKIFVTTNIENYKWLLEITGNIENEH